jgi:beta-mannosidase
VEPTTAAETPSLERVPLTDGWAVACTPPGAADERLGDLEERFVPCTAPVTGAAALAAAGAPAVEDPDAHDWWFRCRFATTPATPDEEVLLRLDGLATVARVWLNGEHVLSCDDMHVEHEVGVTGLLRGENELVIGVAALAPLLEVRRPRPRWRTRIVRHQGLRWLRTTLTGRIPGFAPGPAPVGPWRPVTLVRRRRLALDDVRVRARREGDAGVVDVSATVRALDDTTPETVLVRITAPTGRVTEGTVSLAERDGVLTAEGSVRVEGAEPWWPHTHGGQPLYEVALVVTAGDVSVRHDCGRVGFRLLEVTHEPGLEVAVGGVPVFCRGGALLPDAMDVDQAPAALRAALELARDAGMNMIRLSGVGTYGSEAFFDLCDELGLLVWQDFPFANLDYPVEDEGFRAAVTTEAGCFLDRAGRHPSLAVLCGNSEVEQQVGMLGLDPELGRGPLFGELLPDLVRERAVDAAYVPSSPTGGELPFRPGAGVAHYFGVGAYRRPLEDARRAEVRFASECLAFANVPDDDALDAPDGPGRLVHTPAWKRGVPRDSGTGWDFDDVRDHYLGTLFDLDPVDLRWADPDRYLALSRVVTGEVMAQTLGEWRRARSTCSGALLWTLNDVLPGAGWGVLDAAGRPKAAYWYVRRVLQPLAVWVTDEGTNGVAVHVANDTAETVAATLAVSLVREDGIVVETGSRSLELRPRACLELSAEGVLGHFVDAGWAYRFGTPSAEVLVAELAVDGRPASRSFLFPQGLGPYARPSDELGLEATAAPGDGTVLLRVTSRRLAYGVAVDAPGFRRSDDVFVVPAGTAHEVLLTPLTPGTEPTGLRVLATNARHPVPVTTQ